MNFDPRTVKAVGYTPSTAYWIVHIQTPHIMTFYLMLSTGQIIRSESKPAWAQLSNGNYYIIDSADVYGPNGDLVCRIDQLHLKAVPGLIIGKGQCPPSGNLPTPESVAAQQMEPAPEQVDDLPF